MKNIILCVGTDEKKSIRVRLTLSSDGFSHYHSIALNPGDDLIKARQSVEEHLAMPYEASGIPGAPWPKIPDAEWAEVEAIVATLHTPERVAARRERDRKNAELLATQAAPRTR